MPQETIRLKYLGHKEHGLPVTFPVGMHNKSAVTKIVWASPFIDVTPEEAAYLLKDKANWAEADKADLKLELNNVVKEVAKPKHPRATQAKADKAAAAEKRKPGRPKEYGQSKPAAAIAADPTPVPSSAAVESIDDAQAKRGKKK